MLADHFADVAQAEQAAVEQAAHRVIGNVARFASRSGQRFCGGTFAQIRQIRRPSGRSRLRPVWFSVDVARRRRQVQAN